MIAVGVVLAVVGTSLSLVSGVVGARKVDGAPAALWSRSWWRALGLQAGGQGVFVGGLIFLGQQLGLLRGVAVGLLVMGVVIVAFLAVVWALRSWRRRGVGRAR